MTPGEPWESDTPVLPCRRCGHLGITFADGGVGSVWGCARCGACGRQSLPVPKGSPLDVDSWHGEALRQWNRECRRFITPAPDDFIDPNVLLNPDCFENLTISAGSPRKGSEQ